MTEESPIVREMRKRAMQIEARFDHDLHKYCEHLREQEAKRRDHIVDQIAVVQSQSLR